jgi:hypothetical protein
MMSSKSSRQSLDKTLATLEMIGFRGGEGVPKIGTVAIAFAPIQTLVIPSQQGTTRRPIDQRFSMDGQISKG